MNFMSILALIFGGLAMFFIFGTLVTVILRRWVFTSEARLNLFTYLTLGMIAAAMVCAVLAFVVSWLYFAKYN